MAGISLFATGLFSGIALELNVAEGPARSKLPPQEAQKMFKVAFPRQAAVQALLATTAAVSAGVAAYHAPAGSHDRLIYTVVGGTMFSLLPYTQLALMPTNWTLLAEEKKTDKEIAVLLDKWLKLHAVRTAAGIFSFGLLAFGLKH
eukprot:jgi/Botrbrau1/10030/Bobra.0012s0117.1